MNLCCNLDLVAFVKLYLRYFLLCFNSNSVMVSAAAIAATPPIVHNTQIGGSSTPEWFVFPVTWAESAEKPAVSMVLNVK